MPDFETRTPQQQDRPNKLRIMLTATKLRIALIAAKLRTLLISNRLRTLLLGGGFLLVVGGFLLVVVAIPLGLFGKSSSSPELGSSQQKTEPTSGCAGDRRSQQPFVLSYQNDLWTMSLDGSDLTSLTSTATESVNGEPVSESEPAWSPDRKRIAFTRSHYGAASGSADPEAQYSIYVMNPDGSCETQLLDANASGPTWSPDGKKIAFSKPRPRSLYSIYVMNADGSGDPKRLTTEHLARDANPAWSPDGKKIAFERNEDIYIIDCCEDEEGNTNHAKRLTDGPGWDLQPVWSPDGTELAFTHVDVGTADWGGEEIRNTDVYKIDAEGSRETRLTHTYSSKYPEHDVVWAPSGAQLAFIKGYYTGTDSVNSDTIYLMKSDGSQLTVVKRVPGGYEMDLDWQ
jgi:Tol biopolymer transport system component